MEKNDEGLKQLNRSDRIREEAKRALEFGQTPKRPLSLHPNMRVEGLTAAPRPQCSADNAPGEEFLKSSRVKIVSSRSANPLIAKQSTHFLAEQIQHELKRATDPQQAAKVLEMLNSLTNADPHGETTQALRRKVLGRVFGERYFESERNLPQERSSRGRGSSIFSRGKED
jgi:hypothetical protein